MNFFARLFVGNGISRVLLSQINALARAIKNDGLATVVSVSVFLAIVSL